MRDIITSAIGNVHGCSQSWIARAVNESICAGRDGRLVLIGDYVDRGPDPEGVIDYLIKRQLREPDHSICLRGNHEQMLVAAAAAERSDSDLINWGKWRRADAGQLWDRRPERDSGRTPRVDEESSIQIG
jgi:serine/threonine protein phosphatase 1